MDETRIESIAEKFISLMDRKEEWWNSIIHDNAILDWFGRTIIGRNHIMNFIKIQDTTTVHKIESISKCPPIDHRALTKKAVYENYNNNVVMEQAEPFKECGQGDCARSETPMNQVKPSNVHLLNAPNWRKNLYGNVDIGAGGDCASLKFLEMRGSIKFQRKNPHDSDIIEWEKSLKRIVLGYSKQIQLIVYEGDSKCRRNLSMLFNSD